jgi:hypothetical protein
MNRAEFPEGKLGCFRSSVYIGRVLWPGLTAFGRAVGHCPGFVRVLGDGVQAELAHPIDLKPI